MFEVSEKTIVRFFVDGQEFDSKKEAELHGAWRRLENNLTENNWHHSVEHMLKNDPAQAITALTIYAREVELINTPVNPFRYDNINWSALLNSHDWTASRPFNLSTWGEVVERLNTFIDNNQKINAIKLARIAFIGAGLKETKDWVEDRWTSRDFNIF